MNTSLLYSFCTLFTIINLIIFGSILLFRKNNSTPNKLLAAVIFIPAGTFIVNFFMQTGLLSQYPYIILINFNTLWIVCLTWYVKLLLGQTVKLNLKKIPHLIPLFLNISYSIYFLSLNEVEQSKIFSNINNQHFPWQMEALDVLVMLQMMGYLTYCIVEIKKYEKENNENTANKILIAKTGWLKEFIYLLIVLNICIMILMATVSYESLTYFYIPILFTIFYFAIIYEAFRNSAVFTAIEFEKYVLEEKENKKKYRNSLINEEQVEYLYQNLLSYLELEKPFLNSELSLKELSEKLNTSLHILSQVINQKFEKNFTELMNYYRIEEAKCMLKNIEKLNLSIEGIGLECGFNSSSTFFRAFKKHTGNTPSMYMKERSDRN